MEIESKRQNSTSVLRMKLDVGGNERLPLTRCIRENHKNRKNSKGQEPRDDVRRFLAVRKTKVLLILKRYIYPEYQIRRWSCEAAN